MVREEHNLTPSPPLNSPVGAAPEQRGAEESSPSHGTVHRDELLRSSGKRSGFKNLRILSRKKRPADSYRQCNYIFLDQDTELLSDIVPNDASAPFIADLPLLPPQEALNAKDPCSNVVSSNDSKAYQPMLREGGGRNPTVPNDHVGDAVDVTTAHAHQGVSISTDQNPFGYGVRLKSSIASLSSQFKTRSCWNDTLGSLTNEHRSKRYRHMTTGNSGLQHASHSAEDDMDVEAAYERDHTKVGEPTDQEGFTPTYSGPPSNTAHHANHYPLRSADGLSTYHDNNAMPLFMQPEDAQQTTNEYETTRETQTCWRPLSFFFFLTRLPARWRSQPRYTDASSQRPSNGSLDNSTGIPHDMEDVHVASVPTSTQRGWIQRVRVPSLRSALAERYDSVRTRLAATRERARAVIVERFAGLHEAAGNEDHDVNASGLPMHDDPSYQQLIWFMGILFGPLIFVLGAFLYFLTPRELHKTRLWGFINIVFGSLSLMSFLLNSYQEVPLPASDRVAIYDTVKHFTGHDVFMGGSGSLWVPSSSDASQWTQAHELLINFSSPLWTTRWTYAVERKHHLETFHEITYDRLSLPTGASASPVLVNTLSNTPEGSKIYVGPRFSAWPLPADIGGRRPTGSPLDGALWYNTIRIVGRIMISVSFGWGGNQVHRTQGVDTVTNVVDYGITHTVVGPAPRYAKVIIGDDSLPDDFLGAGMRCRYPEGTLAMSLVSFANHLPPPSPLWFLFHKTTYGLTTETVHSIIVLPRLHSNPTSRMPPPRQNVASVDSQFELWSCRVALLDTQRSGVLRQPHTNYITVSDITLRALP